MKFVQLFNREIKLLKPKLNYSHFKLKNSKMFKIPAQKKKTGNKNNISCQL